ncbi:hypothetical protein [Actinoplanes aureus]|uniref:Cyclophilin-like domain-containing protein n=1 Tax=Actinoplanes aureus TaxID=2792083 RepID=A0A931G0C5_9ACTN|nr:hypothetical protein [Actinoplanes aureus]MBG0566623.1 hypothetical protein [Actinoplanes aureus]
MTSAFTAALPLAALAAALAGCSVASGGLDAGDRGSSSATSTGAGVPVVLRLDGGEATAILTDTPEGQLAAMLPATVELALIRLGSLTSGLERFRGQGLCQVY